MYNLYSRYNKKNMLTIIIFIIWFWIHNTNALNLICRCVICRRAWPSLVVICYCMSIIFWRAWLSFVIIYFSLNNFWYAKTLYIIKLSLNQFHVVKSLNVEVGKFQSKLIVYSLLFSHVFFIILRSSSNLMHDLKHISSIDHHKAHCKKMHDQIGSIKVTTLQ